MRDLIVFCQIIVIFLHLNTFAFGHDIPPPTEIIPKAPRLEEHGERENEADEKLHFHAWCYDTIAGNGNQAGWWPEWYPAKYGHPPYRVAVDPPVDVEPPVDVDPPVVESPIVDPPVVDPPVVESPVVSRFPAGSTDDAPLVASPQIETPRVIEVSVPAVDVVPPSDIVLTQIMFHTWTRAGGGGNPQWFELHNRGGDGTVKDFQLTFFPKGGGKLTIVFKDCPLASGETLIVTPSRVGSFLGHLWGHSQGVDKVYIDADILNLKNNWVLTDSNGTVIYRRSVPWNWGWGEHARDALGRAAYRQAVDVIPSEPWTGETPIYYGNAWDAGNPPGWHVDVVPRAPRLLRKTATTWGALKQPKGLK